MIAAMPVRETPEWLKRIASGKGDLGFPLTEILKDSLYYPACGLDGTPVKYLGGNVHSFIYADYGVSRRSFLANLNGTGRNDGFRGYRPVRQLELQRRDLVPPTWQPEIKPGNPYEIRILLERERNCFPFGHWSVWSRREEFPPEHGPEAFSLMYLGGEMSAVYQGLYLRNEIKPMVLALIQPGAFGGEWEAAGSNSSFFHKVVRSNPAGLPDYLLHGGYGRGFHEQPCWREYEGDRLQKLPAREAGLWRLSDHRTHREVDSSRQVHVKHASVQDLGVYSWT